MTPLSAEVDLAAAVGTEPASPQCTMAVKNNTLLGIALGVAGTLAAPVVVPIVASIGRPLVKDVLKQAIVAFERIREKMKTVAEDLDDLIAEVRIEVHDELLRKGPPGGREARGTAANGSPDATRTGETS